ncbi:MAG: hypothetical protein MJ087_07410 [Lachnospiraceae bacterium]|nr:hypothetical protein [Lachnospiraceae bacterium]
MNSRYVEDIYDSLIFFFEDHKMRPRFLHLDDSVEGEWKITFGSLTEYFHVTGVTKEDLEELREIQQER